MALSSTANVIIKEAASAWKLLNGVVCLYKPLNISMVQVQRSLRNKLCQDLNAMKPMERQEIVQFRRITSAEEFENGPEEKSVIARIGDGKGVIEVFKTENMADHPLVIGQGYAGQDFKTLALNPLGKESSGLAVFGINKGCKTIVMLHQHKWIRSYVISGQFGKATDTFFHTGKVLEKATFHRIRKHMIDRLLASSQASFQRVAFAAAGVPLDSDRAYELASQGLVRPEKSSFPIIYSLQCKSYDPPHFDIELSCVNETEQYLRQFIHDMGLKLNTAAVCTKIRCTKVGPFGLDLALLTKHWTLDHVIPHMSTTKKILSTFDLYKRDPLVDSV